jgi:hypothetical protein
MGMYPGPNSPDRPSPEEFSAAEVDVRIHKFLVLGVSPNPGVGPVPLWRGIVSARVSMLGLVLHLLQFYHFMALVILRKVLGRPWQATGGHFAGGCRKVGGETYPW